MSFMRSTLTLMCLQCVCALIQTNNNTNNKKPVSLKNLCPHSQLKSAFNQLYNNKPGIQLTNQSDSAALVHQIWTDENLHEFEDCVFTVDSNLYSQYGRFGRGIFAAVKKINFRQNFKGECIDYVRFTFMESRTEKICGKFDDESELGKMSIFNEDVGVIKVHVFVNKSVPFQALQRSVEVDLLFTTYESENHFLISQNEIVWENFLNQNVG